MDLTKITINTSRLKLIPTSLKYASDIFKEFTPEITIYMYPRSARKQEETENFIRLSNLNMKSGKVFQAVILNKTTGEFLGHGGIASLDTNTPELGIWIKKSAHGNKYGKEAVIGLKKWLDENVKYKYIIYPVDRKNLASRKIAESLGGIIEDEYKKESLSGNILDEVEYRIYPQKSS